MANNKPSKDYQKELQDRYDTGTADRDIEAAKQEQKKQNDMLMKQGAAMGAPAKEEKKETPMDSLGKAAKKFKKGGTASSRADGCCVRGKTRA
jgi:hypothetical protein